MASRTAVLLTFLASTATATITTSFLLPNSSYGTNRLRFVASVINASDDRVTLQAHVADDPDFSALAGFVTDTFTLAPTLIGYSTSAVFYNHPSSAAKDVSAYSYRCEVPPSASAAACTLSVGPWIAKQRCGATRSNRTRTAEYYTRLWTFSEEGTVGTETLVRTMPGSPTTPPPEWCTSATDLAELEVPSSALVSTFEEPMSHFGLYQFVITAGEEKLPSATTGGAVSTESVASTVTGGSSGGSESPASGTGSPGSAPMKTMAPALAGLGAAVAMFL